jgi:RNA polymerase sigma-70 factor (ECF subfamily)
MSTGSQDLLRTRASLLVRVRDLADHEAWVEFETRYGPMIRGWCRQWFPREMDDRVQDVFVKLIRKLPTFEYDPAKRFRGYLKTLTNHLMMELKEVAPQPAVNGEGLLDLVEARQDLMERLASEYNLELRDQAREHVRGRVENRTWSAFVETAEHGRGAAEVAAELGMKVGAVYQAKHSVISELRREIEFLEGPC